MTNKRIGILLLLLLCSILFPNVVFAEANRHASSVIISNIDAEADGKEKVLINIHLRDKSNNSTNDSVFIGTDRSSLDKFWVKKDKEWVPVSTLSNEAEDTIYYVTSNTIQAEIDGSLELGMTSTVKGIAKVGVSLKGERELRQYLSGHITEAQAEIIPVKYADEPKTVTDTKYYKIAIESESESENEYTTYTENKLYINVFNKSNDIVNIGEDIKEVELNVELLTKPENAQINIDKSPTWKSDLGDAGSTYFQIYSDKPGEVQVEINLKLAYKNSFSSDVDLRNIAKLNITPKQFGAKEIELFLSQETAMVDKKAHKLSLVPFIESGKTFVPVRFIAEALGAEVKWDPETQTIVLSRPDKMVTMTIGNSALLLNTGQVVLSDVAPFIKDGFTVLPFRVIAEAFGAEVSAGYNNAGEIVKVYFYN